MRGNCRYITAPATVRQRIYGRHVSSAAVSKHSPEPSSKAEWCHVALTVGRQNTDTLSETLKHKNDEDVVIY